MKSALSSSAPGSLTAPMATGCVYVSAAANQCRRALAVCPVTGLLVYAAQSRLLVYCMQVSGVGRSGQGIWTEGGRRTEARNQIASYNLILF